MGYLLCGLVFWSAAITSVVGCSYTSISFLRSGQDARSRSLLISGFIALSLIVTLGLNALGWRPTPLLVAAGTLNGVLLPVMPTAFELVAPEEQERDQAEPRAQQHQQQPGHARRRLAVAGDDAQRHDADGDRAGDVGEREQRHDQ